MKNRKCDIMHRCLPYKYFEELTVNEQDFVNASLTDLKECKKCYAFTDKQVQNIKYLYKIKSGNDLEIIDKDWYKILKVKK